MRSIRAFLPAFALAALFVVLGHDAVMAAGPHALQPAAIAGHAGHAGHEPLDTVCHQQEAVRSGPFDAGELMLPGHAVPPLPIELTWQVRADVAWDAPPCYPPDVVRALLQVFLN